jgi:hypothetical protein
MAFKFTSGEAREIETYAALIAAGVCDYTEIALGKAAYAGGRIGVDANSPHRQQMLAAIRTVAVSKGYAGPAFPERDPHPALGRRAVLLELMAGEPRDAAWLEKREFYEGAIGDIALDDPTAVAALKAKLRAAYQPSAPEPSPAADTSPAAHPWAGRAPAVNLETYSCSRGQHRWGERNEYGHRTCLACGVVNIMPDDNPGAVRVEAQEPINVD